MRTRLILAAAMASCLMGACPLRAAEPGQIVVRGAGAVEVVPDTAEIFIGVDTRARTPAEAIDANSSAMERVVADAVRSNVARTDIRTAVLNVTTENDAKLGRMYRADNFARVRVRDLARIGTVVRDLVASGANEMRGIRFSTADPSPHLERARRQAVEDARRKAETLATAAGRKLGDLVEITDQTYDDPGIVAQAAQRTSVPIEPGQMAIRASVQMKWLLAQ